MKSISPNRSWRSGTLRCFRFVIFVVDEFHGFHRFMSAKYLRITHIRWITFQSNNKSSSGLEEVKVDGREDLRLEILRSIAVHVTGSLNSLKITSSILEPVSVRIPWQWCSTNPRFQYFWQHQRNAWACVGHGIHTPRSIFSTGRLYGIYAGQTMGDGIQKNDDIVTTFYQSFSFFDDDVGHGRVGSFFIEGRSNHFALTLRCMSVTSSGALDQQNNLIYLWMIGPLWHGNILQQHSFPVLGWAHDHTRCPFPIGAKDRWYGWKRYFFFSAILNFSFGEQRR